MMRATRVNRLQGVAIELVGIKGIKGINLVVAKHPIMTTPWRKQVGH